MNGLAKHFRGAGGKVIALAVIAAMCFVFAVTGFAVRGYAAEGSVNTTDLVTVSENAATRVSTDTETDKMAKGGLLIESDTLYTGAINGKFEGDVTLGFGFRDNTGFSDGMDFFIDIKDAADPSNMFTVKYRTLNTWDGTGYSGAFVLYGDQVRSSQYWGHDTTWYNQEMSAEGPMCSPMFSGYQGNKFGYLKLVWNEDVLQVQVTNHNSDTDIRTIAAFDGTDSFVSGTSWGLPKLSFPQGYTISFRTTDKAPDMYIYSVEAYEETVDFSKETQATAPQFYTAWQTSDTVMIDVDKTPLTGAVGYAVSAPAATVTVGSGEPQAVYKVSVSGPAGFEAADITSAMSFTPTVAGNYTITYQGVEESESETNTATVSCTVYNYTAASSLIAENEVVKVDAGKVSTSISADGSVTGLRATFGAGDSSFTFNTVFTGDFNIFLQSDLMEVKGGFSEVRLRFKDINNGENYVDVVMMPGIASWANWYTHMLVEYKGEMYTTNKSADNSGTVWNTDQINANKYQTTAGWYEAAGLTDFLANMTERTDTGYTTGYIGFDSETLSFLTEQGGNRYIVASFTDAKYEWTNDFTGFANGYTVEVLAYGAAEGASITMTQLNGVSLAETYLPASMGEQKSILYGEAEKSIEAVQGTYEDEGALLYTLVEGSDFGIIGGEAEYTVKFNGEDAEAVDLTKAGTYVLTYEGGATRTVTVTADVTNPTLKWADGFGDAVETNDKTQIKVAATDVIASDTLDGTLTAVITVKAPDSEEYVAYSEDVFTKCGGYTIRYTATDAAGNSAYLERTVTLIHNYGAWTDNKDGTHSQTCANCGDVKTENCTWNEGVITTEPTCTQTGVKTYTCSVCGATKTETVAALGHTGGTATCHSKAVCTRCGEEYGDLDPDNHDGGTEIRDAKDATCTEAGYTGDTYCKGCNAKLESGKSIDALGHDFSAEWMSDEANHWHKCTRCDAISDKATHAWGEGTVTKSATCAEEGERTYTCECGKVKTEAIAKDANNHTGGTEVRDAVAATAETAGYTGDTYCKGCGAKLADGEAIPALGYTVSVAGGTIEGQSGAEANFQKDTSVTVVAAAPEEGMEFEGWYNGDELVSEDESYTFTVTGNIALTARYAEAGGGCSGTVVFGSAAAAAACLALAAVLLTAVIKRKAG